MCAPNNRALLGHVLTASIFWISRIRNLLKANTGITREDLFNGTPLGHNLIHDPLLLRLAHGNPIRVDASRQRRCDRQQS